MYNIVIWKSKLFWMTTIEKICEGKWFFLNDSSLRSAWKLIIVRVMCMNKFTDFTLSIDLIAIKSLIPINHIWMGSVVYSLCLTA